MVEPPGTAPGSDPLITCAFMSIVRANPDAWNIGVAQAACKRQDRRPAGIAAMRAGRHDRDPPRRGRGRFHPLASAVTGSSLAALTAGR